MNPQMAQSNAPSLLEEVSSKSDIVMLLVRRTLCPHCIADEAIFAEERT